MKRTATLLNEEKDKTLDEMQHTKVLKETLKGYERYQANVLEMNYSYRFRYPWMPCTASHDNYGDSNVLRATELTSPVRAFYRAAGYLEILLGDR